MLSRILTHPRCSFLHPDGQTSADSPAETSRVHAPPHAVPAEALDAERAILREQAARTGKADKFLDRIVEGRLQRFYEDNCLLDQKFVMEDKLSVQVRRAVHVITTHRGGRDSGADHSNPAPRAP